MPLYTRTLCATSETASEYVMVPFVVWNYMRINRQRDAVAAAGGIAYTDKQLREMGDRAPDFRYIL